VTASYIAPTLLMEGVYNVGMTPTHMITLH